MYSRARIILTVVLMWFVTVHTAQAAVLNYNESVDGDIGYPPPLFSLGVGTNTVTGSISVWDNGQYFDFDVDDFSLYLPASTILSSISFRMQLRDDPNNDDMPYFELGYGLQDCGQVNCNLELLTRLADSLYSYQSPDQYSISKNYGYGGTTIGGVSVPVVPIMESFSDLPGDRYYNISNTVLGYGFSSTFMIDDHIDYTFTFNVASSVAAVPLPSAIWLFISGLCMISIRLAKNSNRNHALDLHKK